MPPWINKFYILDLTPEKSFIKWCVDQGLTVFVISWVNPGRAARRRRTSTTTCARAARRARRDRAGHRREQGPRHRLLRRRHAAGDHARLSWRPRTTTASASATLFAAQVDFTYAGDLKVFVDEEQLEALEKRMAEQGYLEGRKMANAFNMLRSNDLIWPYVINNYHARQGADAVRPALLEFRCDAHAGGQSLVLSAQLLSHNKLSQGQDDDRQRQARSQEGESADLQSRHARGSHRAGEIGVRSARSSSAGRCASCSPAPVISPAWSIRRTSRNTSTGPAASRAPDVDGWLARPRSIPVPGGRTGSNGSRRKTAKKVEAREPGGGKLKPIEDAPGATSAQGRRRTACRAENAGGAAQHGDHQQRRDPTIEFSVFTAASQVGALAAIT